MNGQGRRVGDWYYLGFLVTLVFQPALDPAAGALEWTVTGATVAVFAPLYLTVVARPGWLRRHAAPLSTAMALAVFWFNGGATVLFIYAAAFAGSFATRRIALRWFAGLSLLTIALGAVSPVPLPFALFVFAAPIFFIWVVGLSCLDEAGRREESRRLRIDNARVGQLATAAERERIARDLHDVLGQSLTEVIVRAQLARRLAAAEPSAAAREAGEIERAARVALDEVRAVVRGWREVRIDEELDTARRSLEAAGIDLTVDRDPDFDPAPTSETALALMIREAVTNVIRHAHATRCTVALRRSGGDDIVEVADDGSGTVTAEGAGLMGMRERILALGGRFELTDDSGVTVAVRVPAGLHA